MTDQIGRNITYLRISITDRCNLRCKYCMPEDGIKLLPHSQILTFQEIVNFVTVAAKMGIEKVRITGGEPLVRKSLPNLVNQISKIEGINDLSMTTNGQLLKEFAQDLKDAGLQRVNISLDSVDPLKYRQITRGGNLNNVIEGIEEARRAGLNPIKINCVIDDSPYEEHAQKVAEFAKKHGYQIRFIPLMNLRTGKFGQVVGGEGGNCQKCNRLRLTATGMLKPCLFSNIEFSTRELGAQKAIEMALMAKPLKGSHNSVGCFYNIGG